MPDLQVTSFSNTFLIPNEQGKEPILKVVGPSDNSVRKKRAHKKSRNGCIPCKKRKVKCDEKDPCGNCVKRNDVCFLSKGHQSGEEHHIHILPELDAIQLGDGTKPNLLHMELFHHFSQVTVPTLSFPEIWGVILQHAFHQEYLMNAVLAMGAAHLSSLLPSDKFYRRSAMASLSRSVGQFHETLNTPITPTNCDALMGTAILIHYMSWINLEFVESQSPDCETPLDLSRDQLFLLAAGVRQIFFLAHQYFQSSQSVFIQVATFKPCNILEELADRRGDSWQRTVGEFMKLYDNPRYWGGRGPSPLTASQVPPCPCDKEHFDLYTVWNTAVLEIFDVEANDSFRKAMSLPEDKDEAVHAGAVFRRIATRLAVILDFVTEPQSPSDAESNPVPCREDLERYILSFPLLGFSPFLSLVLNGDSRGLVVLYHFYRASRIYLDTQRSWWSVRRSSLLENLIREELKIRGLDVCPREKDHISLG